MVKVDWSEFVERLPEGAHHDRPWWTRILGAGRWQRDDGWNVWIDSYPNPYDSILIQDPKGAYPSTTAFLPDWHIGMVAKPDDVLAAIDDAHPRPMPKIRAGQVWMILNDAWQAGGTIVIERAWPDETKVKADNVVDDIRFTDCVLVSPKQWAPPGWRQGA